MCWRLFVSLSLCVCAGARGRVCLGLCILALCENALAQRIANYEYSLWTIQGSNLFCCHVLSYACVCVCVWVFLSISVTTFYLFYVCAALSLPVCRLRTYVQSAVLVKHSCYMLICTVSPNIQIPVLIQNIHQLTHRGENTGTMLA